MMEEKGRRVTPRDRAVIVGMIGCHGCGCFTLLWLCDFTVYVVDV